MNTVVKILASLLLLCTVSCSEIGPDEPFLSDSTPKLCVSGKETIRYEADFCQLEHNTTVNEFIIIKDDGSDYLKVSLNKYPSESGEEVNATIGWLWGREYADGKKMTFNTEKVEGHTIWLWNKAAQTGLVLRSLE